MMNLEWYRTFKAVYQTGSLTAASKILFISQPNVSQHLSALESYVGQQLFQRKPNLVPTDYGKLFYTQVVDALEKLENVEVEFKAACRNKQLPLLRLGTVKEFFHTIIAGRIQLLDGRLITSFGLTKDLISKLKKEELDFVIATQYQENEKLTYNPVLKESFWIVGDVDLDTKELDFFIDNADWDQVENWLLGQTWFAYSADLMMIRRFWLHNFKKRPPIKPKYIIPDMDTVLLTINRIKGITIVADYVALPMIQENKLKLLWKGHSISENILYLVYDRKKVTAGQLTAVNQLFEGLKDAKHKMV
jgi:DNA-binding transcriptional LysR family regulator